ncbi:ABC transporter ATP-binding protein [Buchananella felis]|uniref:ABC transporter ATP-binding protein n=1 Tax=Buchananella felis TaxID=3231492 RepID=UPI003529A8AA
MATEPTVPTAPGAAADAEVTQVERPTPAGGAAGGASYKTGEQAAGHGDQGNQAAGHGDGKPKGEPKGKPDGKPKGEPKGKPDGKPKGALQDLLEPVRKQMGLSMALGFLAAAFGLVPVVALTYLAERAVAGTATPTVAWTALALTAAGFILSHLLHGGATGFVHRVESAYRHQLRSRILRHLARLPLGWHNEESSGRMRTLVTEDVTRIHTIIAHFGPDLGLGIGTPLLGLAFLFTRSWLFAVILLIWEALVVLGYFLLSRASRSTLAEEYMDAEKNLTAATVELSDGIATVKAFGRTQAEYSRFEAAVDRYTGLAYEYMKSLGTATAVFSAFLAPAALLLPVAVAGFFLARGGLIEPVTILPFALVGISLTTGLNNMVMVAHMLWQGRDSAERIHALLQLPQLPEPTSPQAIARTRDGVALDFEHVCFRYEADGVLALDDVTAHLPAGSVTAVVGPSGSGKSTLVRLLARFWDVSDGAVKVGGVDVRDAATTDLLSTMGVVLQEGGILHDTVEANIALARPGANRAEIEQAARMALIHDRICELADGYNTVLGDEGGHLSGGERQRIALARIFLADSPVILLDEATAQADPHSERLIQEALARLAQGRTVVVIAHRLSTIRDVDQILVLDGGRLVEQGTHAELASAGGTYQQMWEAQQ